MDEGKNIIFAERRMEKAQSVNIKFIDANNNFNVTDETGFLKYVGIVKGRQHKDNYCTCQSFYHGNSEQFQAEHGYAFSCKHILKAIQIRFSGYPE